MRPILTMTWTYLVLATRIKSAFLFSFVYPFAYLFLYFVLFGSRISGVQIIGPLMAFTVLSRALFGVSSQFTMMRERDILKRYWLAPIAPVQIIVSRLIGNYFLLMLILLAQLALAVLLFHMPLRAPLGEIVVYMSCAVFAVCAIGLLVPSVVNTVQEGQILNQTLFFLFIVVAGATLPLSYFPKIFQQIATILPPAVMTVGFNRMFVHGAHLADVWPLAGDLIVTAATCVAIAAHAFRWDRNQRVTKAQRVKVVAALSPLVVVASLLIVTKAV